MFNQIILIGNLGSDVETHTFNDGNKIAKFSLATSETYKDKKGEKKTETQWHQIIVKGNSAEVAEKYLSKGDKIQLQGMVKYRKYESNGTSIYVTEVFCRQFLFLTTKGKAAEDTAKPAAKSDEKDDDLPF